MRFLDRIDTDQKRFEYAKELQHQVFPISFHTAFDFQSFFGFYHGSRLKGKEQRNSFRTPLNSKKSKKPSWRRWTFKRGIAEEEAILFTTMKADLSMSEAASIARCSWERVSLGKNPSQSSLSLSSTPF